MKKILALLALVLGVVSCQTEPEGLDVNVGGEVETTVCVSLPEATRANSAVGALDNNVLAGENTLRYILQIYQGIKDNEGNVTEWVASKETKFEYSDEQSVVFPVRLVPNRDYKFVVWADIVKGENAGDNYYITGALNSNNEFITDLTDVTIDATKWNAMDEARDAYTGVVRINDYKSTSSINIPLTRPFAKLRVLTTDMQALANLGLRPEKAVVKYNADHYSAFDALEGKPATDNKISNKSHTITDVATYGEAGTLFVDYFFATEEQETIKFELTVYDQNGDAEVNKIKYNNFNTDIAVQRNYLTTIQGNILTDGNNVKVTVDDIFANYDEDGKLTNPNYEYATISSEAELRAAINGQGGEYIVVSDIVVTGNSASTLAATRAAGATTINLNGYTITLKADVEIPAGKTVIITDINENGEVGAIVSENGGKITNNGTLNIEGGRFGADTIENNNGEVNITGGTFESNPSNFVDDDYAVVENNGEFTLVQKEEAVKINDTIYRSIKKAVAAAQNGETVKFIADVEQKDGVIITDKNITIDLGDYTFTVTEGANTNNRNFKVNGSSVVTIKNGTMVAAVNDSPGAYGTLRTEGTANVTLNDVKLYNYRGNGLNVKACSGTTVTINDSEIYSQYGGGVEAAGGTVELTNVKIEQKGMYTAPYNSMAISVNGGGTATVNSGTYSTECITAEEANNQGTSHGPWCAGVLNSGGTLIIKGGTFSNDNFGDNALATAARGLLLADTGAKIQIEGGIFNAVKKIIDIQNNLGNASKNPTATISGGDFSADPLTWDGLISVAEGLFVVKKGDRYIVKGADAMVGTTSYGSIDEAIAAWTHNTTLTLLNDVELSDVITLKSTEHHILDLGTYTMTAASGKDAFVIKACGTGDAERNAITIKADATNPGSINAGNKCIVYYKYADGGISGNDRPIIKIEGGIFTGSTSSWGTAGIYTIGSAARQCATLNISGGTFNCSINGSGKSKLIISGGLFHHSVGSQGDSTALRLISGGTFKSLGFMTADSNNTKFWFGTSMANSNVGLYINDDNYLVVGGPVITEFGDKFAAKATNATKWSSYLQYSSAATNGLYYTNADMAIKKHGEANVVLK